MINKTSYICFLTYINLILFSYLGLMDMCEGEKRKLVIPSHLGYGDHGAPPKIPGNITRISHLTLIKIY